MVSHGGLLRHILPALSPLGQRSLKLKREDTIHWVWEECSPVEPNKLNAAHLNLSETILKRRFWNIPLLNLPEHGP